MWTPVAKSVFFHCFFHSDPLSSRQWIFLQSCWARCSRACALGLGLSMKCWMGQHRSKSRASLGDICSPLHPVPAPPVAVSSVWVQLRDAWAVGFFPPPSFLLCAQHALVLQARFSRQKPPAHIWRWLWVALPTSGILMLPQSGQQAATCCSPKHLSLAAVRPAISVLWGGASCFSFWCTKQLLCCNQSQI